jgi:hypothetical protein
MPGVSDMDEQLAGLIVMRFWDNAAMAIASIWRLSQCPDNPTGFRPKATP